MLKPQRAWLLLAHCSSKKTGVDNKFDHLLATHVIIAQEQKTIGFVSFAPFSFVTLNTPSSIRKNNQSRYHIDFAHHRPHQGYMAQKNMYGFSVSELKEI